MQVRLKPEPDETARRAILRALELREAVRTATRHSPWWRAGVREGLREAPRPGGYVSDSL